MFYYQLTVQYSGTNFDGFQFQPKLITVQSKLNQELTKLVKGKITTRGTSRTDSGVHAYFQLIKITSEQTLFQNESDKNRFLNSFNQLLFPDIICLTVDTCSPNFKPNIAAKSKEYRYFFTNHQMVPIQNLQFMANFSRPLDFDKIQLCLEALAGEHDFCNFSSMGSNVTNTIRSIDSCELSKVNPHIVFQNNELFQFPEDIAECYQLKIIGKGFLKQMIRHIVSALWMVGSGKLSVLEFKQLLNSSKRDQHLWKVAPANGLFLFKIEF